MQIYISTLKGKRFQLRVELHDTIEIVKSMIEEQEGIGVSSQRLLLNGIHLVEGKTLSDYEIKNNSVLVLTLNLRGGGGNDKQPPDFEQQKNIFFYDIKEKSHKEIIQNSPNHLLIKEISGRVFALKIQGNETVKEVKESLSQHLGYSVNGQQLSFCGKKINLNSLMSELPIQNNSLFCLSIPLKGGFQIYVKTLVGKTITLEVEADESIQVIKAMIEEKEGIPINDFKLLLRGKEMEEDKKISDYSHYLREGTIHIVPRIKGG